MEMLLDTGEEVESLQAVDAELFEEIVVGRQLFARDFEMFGSQAQHFIRCFLDSVHVLLSCHKFAWVCMVGARRYGRYGNASVLSTNLRRPASTAGRMKSSQKISISRRSSSWGIGLMNFLAAMAVPRSNFLSCDAVERATRRASPSATT